MAYKVYLGDETAVDVQADSVGFEEGGVLAFYEEPTDGNISDEDELLAAYESWEIVVNLARSESEP